MRRARSRPQGPLPGHPGRDQVGGLGPGAGRLQQVVIGPEELQPLVGRAERGVHRPGVALVDAGVGGGVHDQRRDGDAAQVWRGRALRGPQAPHRQPRPQRAQRPDAEHAVVGPDRLAQVAPVGTAVGGLDGGVDHPQVGPCAVHGEQPVPGPGPGERVQLGQRPVGDALVPPPLRLPVAALEVRGVRRPVPGAERVERRIGGQRIGLGGDRGVEPGGQHLGAARVGGERDEQVAGRQVLDRGQRPHPGDGGDAGLGGLRLIGGHEGPAAGVAQQHDPLRARLLAQPPDADPDLRERVVEQEMRLVPPVTGVPAEEAVTALGQERGQVVLGEVHVVVRGDEGGRGPRAGRPVVDPLARVATGARPAGGRGRQPHELPHDVDHRRSLPSERLADS